MGRTLRDIQVLGPSLGTVRMQVMSWLRDNDFAVVDPNADGTAKKYSPGGFVTNEIHPKPGSLVVVKYERPSLFVLELAIYPTEHGTTVHVEGYVAGAGRNKGQETDFETFAGMTHVSRGSDLLSDLERLLVALSTSAVK
jgi:hypothetical protein